MKEMQERVEEVVKKYNLSGDASVKYIDLTSEVGELGKEILKGNDYGAKEFEKTEDTALELGDVLFSLICVANELNIDMDDALNAVLAKYASRFEEKSDIGSGNQKMKIILARHGETDWNLTGQLMGQQDIILNGHGKEQAAILREKLVNEQIVYRLILSVSTLDFFAILCYNVGICWRGANRQNFNRTQYRRDKV